MQTDLHREVFELAASAQHMTLGDTRGVLQRIMEKARRGIQIVTSHMPRDPVDRPVRGRGVSQGGSRPRAPALDDLASGNALCNIKNLDWLLHIGKVLLKINAL